MILSDVRSQVFLIARTQLFLFIFGLSTYIAQMWQ